MCVKMLLSISMFDCLLTVLIILCPGLASGYTNDDRIIQVEDTPYLFPDKIEDSKFIAFVTSKAAFCTASIINEYWILTAAHCFYLRKRKIGNKDAKIKAGVTNYESGSGQSKQEFASEEIHVHPSFKEGKPSKFDIALVKLRDPFVFDQFVGKIEVAEDSWSSGDDTQQCQSFGFGGYRSTAPATTDLKKWNVTFAAHGDDACPCLRKFQSKRLVCAREHNIALICSGDDGGPLVCGNKVRAIAHMVMNRVTCDEPVYPNLKCVRNPERALSLYMFLCPLNDWMHSVVPDIPTTPQSCDGVCVLRSVTLMLFCVCIRRLFT